MTKKQIEQQDFYLKQNFGLEMSDGLFETSIKDIPEFKDIVNIAKKIVEETPDKYFEHKTTKFNNREDLLNHLCTITQHFTGRGCGGNYYSALQPRIVNDEWRQGERYHRNKG